VPTENRRTENRRAENRRAKKPAQKNLARSVAQFLRQGHPSVGRGVHLHPPPIRHERLKGTPMDNTAARSATTPIPAEVLDILGDPPILSTEDGARYHAMLAAFAQQVDPGDFITWCYI
jgi:hypothetical protein